MFPARLVTLVALIPLVLGCPRSAAVWLLRPGPADELEFGVSDKRGGNKAIQFLYMTVSTCTSGPEEQGEIVWEIVDRLDGSAAPYPTRVRYGDAPHGFDVVTPARRLEAGCYRVNVAGTGSTTFVIDSTGSAHAAAIDSIVSGS